MRMQELQIEQLQMQIQQLETDNMNLAQRKPAAGMRLPPLEHHPDVEGDEMEATVQNTVPVYPGEQDVGQ